MRNRNDHPARSPCMHAFAQLLDSLIYTRGRNAKLKLVSDYLRATPDPDRGWAMAALTGDLDLPGVKPALIRALIESRVDPVLFRMSRDYVGDTAEVVALLFGRAARSARAGRRGGRHRHLQPSRRLDRPGRGARLVPVRNRPRRLTETMPC